MILTGKALEAFEKWLKKETSASFTLIFWGKDFRTKSGWIIAWLDTQNILIEISRASMSSTRFRYAINLYKCNEWFFNRELATAAAIEYVNKIYNDKIK